MKNDENLITNYANFVTNDGNFIEHYRINMKHDMIGTSWNVI